MLSVPLLVVLFVAEVVTIGWGGLALDMILAPFSAFIWEKILAAAVTATAAFAVAVLLGLLEDRMFLTRLLIVLEVVLTVFVIPLPAEAPLALEVALLLGVVECKVILVLACEGPTLILRLLTLTVVGMLRPLLLLVVLEFATGPSVLLVLNWAKLTAVVVGLLKAVDVLMMLLGADDSVSVFGGCITDIPEVAVDADEMIPDGCIKWI